MTSRNIHSRTPVVNLCASFAALIGVLVIFGWIVDIPVLKSVLPGYITMKFNTAICFLFAAIMLAARNKMPSKPTFYLNLVLGLIVTSICLLTLAEYLLNSAIHIDELFVPDPDGYSGRFPPGRLAPITAINFIFFCTAIWTDKVRSSRAIFIAQGFAIVVLFAAFQSLIGYAVGLNYFFGVAFYTQMAVHTSIGFAALAIGFLALRPYEGVMQSLTSKTPTSTSMRWVFIAAVFVPVGVRTLAYLGYQSKLFDQDFLQLFELVGITAVMAAIISIIAAFRLNAEQEAQAKHEAAEEANAAKGQLLANVSHEIRTPLGAIIGFTELLKSPETTADEREEYLEILERNSLNLLRLLDDVLDLSKLEAGKIALESRDVSLTEILQDVKKLMQLKSDEKGLTFSVESEASVPDRVVVDSLRLRQILINLIGNAIKFTEHGSIRVVVSYDEPLLKLAVFDTGIGISLDDRAKLFQPFSQSDPSMTRTYGGTGLGLILSKRLAQALEGELTLSSSTVGSGSVFTAIVKAPLPSSFSKNPPKNENRFSNTLSELENLALNNMTVLIVDDSVDNQLLIQTYLRNSGAVLKTASNGQEAFDIAMAVQLDAILMDVQMPVVDGHEATRRLRAAGFKKPIIALTAHAMKEERDHAFKSGCDAYLTKPIDRRALIDTLRQYR